MQQIGIHAIVSIFTYLIMIGLAFRAVQSLRLEKIFKKGHNFEIQLFLIFIAIALGFLVGQFFVTLIDQSLYLKVLF